MKAIVIGSEIDRLIKINKQKDIVVGIRDEARLYKAKKKKQEQRSLVKK
jgi:hypothetical protein